MGWGNPTMSRVLVLPKEDWKREDRGIGNAVRWVDRVSEPGVWSWRERCP